jgi:5-methylthioribose kinase
MKTAEIIQKIEYANKVINDFSINNIFDPMAAFSGTETRTQKLYGAAVEYLEAIEKATDKFITDQKKCL